MIYDIAIIGGGPAGLMAARTAAAQGLKAVLFEKRKDVSRITRACCEQLIMDEDFQGDTMRLEDGKIVSLKNGFSVAYSGLTVEVPDKYFLSPAGRAIHFAYPDRRPIVIKIDKGLMLRGLWEECAAKGADMRCGGHVHRVKDEGDAVSVSVSAGGAQEVVKARKLVIADGVNSRTAEKLGINRQRRCFASALCVIYILKGVEGYDQSELNTYFGRSYCGLAPITMNASLHGPDVASLVVIGNNSNTPEALFRNMSAKGALAPVLKGASIQGKMGCAARAYTSLRTPHAGNVLVIGDAAAYVEVEMQGAFACGYRAALAVEGELAGKQGFGDYTAWWQKSFEFNGDDYLQVAQGFALVPTYADDELDYLFGLIENETLEGTYNQYKSPRLMWGAILKHEEQIKRERPDLHTKITSKKMTLSDML